MYKRQLLICRLRQIKPFWPKLFYQVFDKVIFPSFSVFSNSTEVFDYPSVESQQFDGVVMNVEILSIECPVHRE